MNFKKLISLIQVTCFAFLFSFAQNGKVKGIVFDKGLNEALIGVTVVIEGTTQGVSSDIDGSFILDVQEGISTLVFSYIGYDTYKKEISISNGEVLDLGEINLSDDVQELESVVITAKKVTNTVQAMDNLEMKSSSVINAISSQSIQKSGDSNAASALKRVTGVSVQGGKYVYVRGLSDRYTKSVLNGLDIPGLDPDKNNVQMDLFPSNIINNVIVNKTFVPYLPGDFTGGVVNIQTKDFPEAKTSKISIGTAYRTNSHFNNDFILYKGSNTDWLAFDNGTRGMPFARNIVTPIPSNSDGALQSKLTQLTKSFSPQMAVENQTALLDRNIGYTYGDQIKLGAVKLGFNAAVNYSASSTFIEDAKFGEYVKVTEDPSDFKLQTFRETVANIGEQENTVSGLASASVKVADTKVNATVFHVQNATSRASENYDKLRENNISNIVRHSLTYEQRALTNASVNASQNLGKLEAKAKGSFTKSSIQNPDMRNFALAESENIDGQYQLALAEGAKITRDWRFLDEINFNGGLDFSYNFNEEGNTNKLQFGALSTFKDRDFDIYAYRFLDRAAQSGVSYDFDPNAFFSDEMIWTVESEKDKEGIYVQSSPEPQNQYSANSSVHAAYAMHDVDLNKFNFTYGLRVEKAKINFTGQDVVSNTKYNNETVLDDLDILPSLNVTYKLNEKSNLKASLSNTVARPSFKEKSTVSIFDPISSRRFTGNLNVNATDISNLDLRYENFFNKGEKISISGFYKYFQNPIFLIFELTAPQEIKAKNTANAVVFGGEIEFRKNIVNGLQIGTNFTYLKSIVELTEDELKGRISNLREGETLSTTRSMFGQSPFLVNTFLNLTIKEIGLDANVSYNVEGKKLAVVGIGRVPDVFELPFHSLNFKASKKLGDKFNLSLSAKNILGQKERKYFQSFGADDEIFSELFRGRLISLGLSFNPLRETSDITKSKKKKKLKNKKDVAKITSSF